MKGDVESSSPSNRIALKYILKCKVDLFLEVL